MEKIAALRLFVPLTVLLIVVLAFVAYKNNDASQTEHSLIFLERRLLSVTPSPTVLLGNRCKQDNPNPRGDCADPNAQCDTNDICVCSANYVAESPGCKAKVDTPCENHDCMEGADCVSLPTTNSPAPSAHQTTMWQPPTTSQPSTTPPSTTPSTTPQSSPTSQTPIPIGRRKRQSADRVCRCKTGYYTTKFRTCASRIDLDQACEPLDHSPCKNPDVTVCHQSTGSGSGFTCQCNSKFFSSAGNCTPRLKAGTPCPGGGDVCVEHASCPLAPTANPTPNPTPTPRYTKCTCGDDYFRDNDGLCQTRVNPGQSCTIPAHGEDPCVINAHCHSGICQCPQDLFKQTASGCQKLIEPGTHGCGTDKTNCVANAECTAGGFCECESGFFDNSTIHLCQLRKAPMSSCIASVECVHNATCSSNVCTCEKHYYADQQRCNPRLSFKHPCHVSDECLLNGECIQGHCLCNDKSFNNENTNCPLTLKVGEPCNWYNNDPRQCQSNSTCVFRPIDSHPVCGCDIDHFFNSQYCVKRALAGDPCPYETRTSMGLSMENDEFLKQCVENAHCEDTYKVCKCNDDHYNRAGRCPLQIAVDGYCDPWTDNIDQCASNAQCVFGRCVGGVTVGPVIG